MVEIVAYLFNCFAPNLRRNGYRSAFLKLSNSNIVVDMFAIHTLFVNMLKLNISYGSPFMKAYGKTNATNNNT